MTTQEQIETTYKLAVENVYALRNLAEALRATATSEQERTSLLTPRQYAAFRRAIMQIELRSSDILAGFDDLREEYQTSEFSRLQANDA